MKTNERTSQLEKGFIRGNQLLPTDQEPTRTIEPGEEPLHLPASGLLGWLQRVGKFRLRACGWPILLPSVDEQATELPKLGKSRSFPARPFPV